MLITLLVLLFGLQQRSYCITSNTTHASGKDIEFANSLKQDLRRNNDDYIDKLKIKVAQNKRSGADNVPKTNVKDQLADYKLKPNLMLLGKNANRRNVDFSDEVDYNKDSNTAPDTPAGPDPAPAPAETSLNLKRFQKVTMPSAADTDEPQQPLISPGYLKYIKKGKIDKFKQFMDKNKDLIQDFIVNKRKEEGPTTAPMPTLEASFDSGEQVARAKYSEERRQRSAPQPYQLDMAPAKGGRIHSMRLRGRLCQRHVLIPEGPKYDSKGLVYLAEFKRRGADYPQTKAPRLLLPRCCNCCEKSVLGCE